MDQPRTPDQSNLGQQDAPPMRVVQQPEAEKELYSWQAPERMYKKRNREFYTTLGAIAILLAVILLFAQEVLLVIVMAAIIFLYYAMNSIKPEQTTHILTNKGIRTAGKLYRYQLFTRFWWEEKWDEQAVHLEMPFQFPGKVVLLLGEGDQDILTRLLSQYVVQEKPEPTFVDRASTWLQEKIPLDVG